MDPTEIIPNVAAIPEEKRLVRQAKAGNADAFVALYDSYSDDLYRYVFFRVLSDVAAEAIISQVFRHAWSHLDSYRKRDSSFAAWLYRIARNQVLVYYKVNLRSDAFDIRTMVAAADYRLNQEAQERSPGESWGNCLVLLTDDIEQSRLQTTAALIMREYLDYLHPRRPRQPSPTFNAYTRTWLIRYLQLHERRPKPSPIRDWATATYASLKSAFQPRAQQPGWLRLAPAYAMLLVALFITGTVQAQSALPGDPLYEWKRTSEQVWLSVSPDPVGTELALADRRLSELVAVENDPTRSQIALDGYVGVLDDLKATTGAHIPPRVADALGKHRPTLEAVALTNPQVSTFLAVANIPPTSVPTTAAVTASVPTATLWPTQVPATATAWPTQVPPTATPSATAVTPTATDTPTEVPPTATSTATEVPPSPTTIPTDTPVPPTEVPTETPAPTEVPTEVVPTPTEEVPSTVAPTPSAVVPEAGEIMLPGN